MNLELIANLINLMEKSSLSVLEVENNGVRVRMECQRTILGGVSPTTIPAQPISTPAIAETQASTETVVEQSGENQVSAQPVGHQEICSPMVGTFHALSEPIKIGSQLKKGDPVCIIEAMKVMNEIVMEKDGKITWVAVEPGDMVEYGQVLYMFE